jgi:hypothetical protein
VAEQVKLTIGNLALMLLKLVLLKFVFYQHIQMMHGKAGWKKNVFGIGDTVVFGEYAEHKLTDLSVNSSFYGAGIQQSIDAGAMDVFLSVRQYKSDILSGDATVGMAGLRVRF